MLRNLILILILITWQVKASSQVLSQHPQVSVSVASQLPSSGSRPVCMSTLSNGNLFYSGLDGELYEVVDQQAVLRYTASDHQLPYVSHMEVKDDIIYMCGSVLQEGDTLLIGYVVEGDLTTGTFRLLAESEPHYIGNGFKDHRFSSLLIGEEGDYVYVHCGTRTNAGEIHQLPNTTRTVGLREEPIRTNLFKLPTNVDSTIYISNDSLTLANSGLVYVTGLRHLFAMAWGTDGDFYGASNSDRRDVAEAFYKIEEGRHYGFPWWIGGEINPLLSPDYNPSADRLVPSGANNQGYYNYTEGFPTLPEDIDFVQPYRNIGPDADKYRRPDNGNVEDASQKGTSITTFSGHRSPTGLYFDQNLELLDPFQGDGLMVSWSDNSRLLNDDGHDLISIKLLGGDSLSATQLVSGLKHPMDVVILDSIAYVLEMGNSNGSGRYIYEVQFNQVPSSAVDFDLIKMAFYPNPVKELVRFEIDNPKLVKDLMLVDAYGRLVKKIDPSSGEFYVNDLPPQVYYIRLAMKDGSVASTKLIKGE